MTAARAPGGGGLVADRSAERRQARLMSVETGTSAQTIEKMLRVLFPDAWTVLDMTYGSGKFWTGDDRVSVTGIDLNPARARDVVADFARLPFDDSAFDICVFDPPYLSDTSRKTASIMDARFGSYRSEREAKVTVQAGMREAWRVARLGAIVKVQDHCHASLFVDMQSWIRDVVPVPTYGKVEQIRPTKLMDPKWSDQLSVWSNSATFLAFRHGDQHHKRRQSPLFAAAAADPVAGGSGTGGREG